VRHGIPDEVVDVRITGRDGDGYLAEVEDWIVRSDKRKEPVCLHAGQCGGCDWQHIHYPDQILFKEHQIRSLFENHHLQIPHEFTSFPSGKPYHYRNKLVFSFTSRRWFEEEEGMVADPLLRAGIGFNKAGEAHKIIAVKECYLMEEPVVSLVKMIFKLTQEAGLTFFDFKNSSGLLKNLIVRMDESGKMALVFILMQPYDDRLSEIFHQIRNYFPAIGSISHVILNNVSESPDQHALHFYYGEMEPLRESANGLEFIFHPFSFYQANREQAKRIFQKITELADLTGYEKVVDLYCGIGTISLHLARNAGFVTGIEGNSYAIQDAIRNAQSNEITNVQFILGDVLQTFNEEFLVKNGQPDLVVLDPPRSGTLIEVKKTIMKSHCKKIIYLSCNPVTLVRDLKMLTSQFTITGLFIFDMFPQTYHIETLVLLQRDS
jgi:23S rRNA (uracil1939-C5)-methyltransferase